MRILSSPLLNQGVVFQGHGKRSENPYISPQSPHSPSRPQKPADPVSRFIGHWLIATAAVLFTYGIALEIHDWVTGASDIDIPPPTFSNDTDPPHQPKEGAPTKRYRWTS